MKKVIDLPLVIFLISFFTIHSFSQENNNNYYIQVPSFSSPPKIDG